MILLVRAFVKNPDLLILDEPYHGLDDDNVFFSNTASYIEALINAGVDFDMQVYPGKEHSITGFSHRKHLFTRILRFFDDNLK